MFILYHKHNLKNQLHPLLLGLVQTCPVINRQAPTLTLLALHKAFPLEQVEHPERAPETHITSAMVVSRGHDRVEEAQEVEEEITLNVEEDLAVQDSLDNPETEVRAFKINQIHPSDLNQVTILATILMSVLEIANLRQYLLRQLDQDFDKMISRNIVVLKNQRSTSLMET